MSAAASPSADPFAYDPREPLALSTRSVPAPPHHPDLRALHFELASRGDRVSGRLLLPPGGDGPFPLVLLQHGAGGAKDAPYLDATGGPWARAGAAVASIDFPLHGSRANGKLTQLVLRGSFGSDAPAALLLAREFARQAVVDLRRTLDAAPQLPGVDAERCVYAGFSLGTLAGAIFCGLDPRPRAAALAVGGGGLGPQDLDPTRYVARIAPRPVLFVNAERDATFPRTSAEALFDAADEPKQQLWFDGTHQELPGIALKAMWEFLRPHLGIA